MAFRPSLRWDQEDFIRALDGATGHETLLEERAYDIIGIGSTTGKIRWMSPSVTTFLGWAPSELVGAATTQLIHPDDLSVMLQGRSQILDGGAAAVELRIRSRSGRFRHFRCFGGHLTNADGEIVGTIGGWRCIDEEVAGREALARTAARLRHLLDSMSDPYVALEAEYDPDGTLTDFVVSHSNSAAAQFVAGPTSSIVGVTTSEAVNETRLTWFVPLAEEVLTTKESLSFRNLGGADIGAEPGRFFDVTIDPIDDSSVGVRWSDTTDFVRNAAEAAQREHDRALELERDRIASDLHDGVIQKVLSTGMALSALAFDLPEPLRARVIRIVDDQAELSRQLRGTIFSLARPDLDLHSPSRLVDRTAREATMHLEIDVSSSVDGPLDDIADKRLLQHMLFALREMILNVVRHAQAHSVKIGVVVSDDRLTVNVDDDGVGPDSTNPHDRLGHGLTNLDQRARQLGGSFQLSALSRGGSRAEWSVPLHEGSAAAPPSA